MIDKGTADKYGFKVGDPIEILFQGPPQRFTVVGIVKFGKANGLGGATVAAVRPAGGPAAAQPGGHL